MDQVTDGSHSAQRLLYSLQQPQEQQSEVTLLPDNPDNMNAMDMCMLDRQRKGPNAQPQLNWPQQQQFLRTNSNSEQIHGPFISLLKSSEMLSDGIITSEWQQLAEQNGHLLPANPGYAMNLGGSMSCQESALRQTLSRSMSSPNGPLNLHTDWSNLSNNTKTMYGVENEAIGRSALKAPACLGPFPSDPGFTERAAKYSSLNGKNWNARLLTSQRASVGEMETSSLEFLSDVARNEPQVACSNDSESKKAFCRTACCPPTVENAAAETEKSSVVVEESAVSEKSSAGDIKTSNNNAVKKRKSGRNSAQNHRAADSEESKEKRTKAVHSGDKEKEDVMAKTEQCNSDNSVDFSPKPARENPKPLENQKQDYIHVRARRGQATDSHSLAERVRREKISARMKYLQDLVPGCNKVTGRAVMLDEIINYVQSLQRQVEFLSMKLAAVNPSLEFNIDNFLAREMMMPIPPPGNFSSLEGMSPNAAPYIHIHQMLQQQQQQQQASLQAGACTGLDVPTLDTSTSLHRPGSAEMFADAANFQGHAPSSWDSELQNVFSMGLVQDRQPPFPSEGLPGHLEPNHMKMEM